MGFSYAKFLLLRFILAQVLNSRLHLFFRRRREREGWNQWRCDLWYLGPHTWSRWFCGCRLSSRESILMIWYRTYYWDVVWQQAISRAGKTGNFSMCLVGTCVTGMRRMKEQGLGRCCLYWKGAMLMWVTGKLPFSSLPRLVVFCGMWVDVFEGWESWMELDRLLGGLIIGFIWYVTRLRCCNISGTYRLMNRWECIAIDSRRSSCWEFCTSTQSFWAIILSADLLRHSGVLAFIVDHAKALGNSVTFATLQIFYNSLLSAFNPPRSFNSASHSYVQAHITNPHDGAATVGQSSTFDTAFLFIWPTTPQQAGNGFDEPLQPESELKVDQKDLLDLQRLTKLAKPQRDLFSDPLRCGPKSSSRCVSEARLLSHQTAVVSSSLCHFKLVRFYGGRRIESENGLWPIHGTSLINNTIAIWTSSAYHSSSGRRYTSRFSAPKSPTRSSVSWPGERSAASC